MKKAKLLKDGLDGFNGYAALYKLSPPLKWSDYDKKKHSAEYVVVSAAVVMFSGPETYIFKADKKGKHEGLKFRFRPPGDSVHIAFRRIIDRDCKGDLKAELKAADEEADFIADTLVKHLVSWEGRAAVDKAGVLALPRTVRQKLFDQVLGYTDSEGAEKN